MPVIAVTGNLCSGKSTVVRFLRAKGVRTLSADRLVHACYRDKKSDVYKAVKKYFPGVIDTKGNISRKELAHIVFTNRNLLKKLEHIVHPGVIEGLKEWVASKKDKKGIYLAEIPLLFEKNIDKLFDAVIFVDSPKALNIKRARCKFGISKNEAIDRIANFIPSVIKRNKSSFIIYNDSNMYELRKKAGAIWQKLRKMR